jgi:hypothetical protein
MYFSRVPPITERDQVAAHCDDFEESVPAPESQEKEEPTVTCHILLWLQNEDIHRGKGGQRSIQVMLSWIRKWLAERLSQSQCMKLSQEKRERVVEVSNKRRTKIPFRKLDLDTHRPP